jgi:hypothetical protein
VASPGDAFLTSRGVCFGSEADADQVASPSFQSSDRPARQARGNPNTFPVGPRAAAMAAIESDYKRKTESESRAKLD